MRIRFNKLGRCPLCMRWALRGAVIGWAAVNVIRKLAPRWSYLLLPLPLSFTALWCLHIVVFGRRAIQASASREFKEGSVLLTRSSVLRFARAAAFGVAVSAMLPSMGRTAECDEGFSKCNGVDACCPKGYRYYCSHNSCKRDQTYKCYQIKTDEQLAHLRDCCDGVFVSCG